MARKIQIGTGAGVIESEVSNGDLILLGYGPEESVEHLNNKKAIAKEEGEIWHEYPKDTDYHVMTLPESVMRSVELENKENYVVNAISELVLTVKEGGFGVFKTMNSKTQNWVNGRSVEVYGFSEGSHKYDHTQVSGSNNNKCATLDIKLLGEEQPITINSMASYKKAKKLYGKVTGVKISDHDDNGNARYTDKIWFKDGTEISSKDFPLDVMLGRTMAKENGEKEDLGVFEDIRNNDYGMSIPEVNAHENKYNNRLKRL